MSQNGYQDNSSALRAAWQHFAEFSTNADQAQKWHIRLRKWVIILSVVATLAAILTDLANQQLTEAATISQILKFVLISIPITGSAVLAFSNKFQRGERWLALRAGEEEIKKEIYLYRTLRRNDKSRDQWLNEQVADIQRRAFEALDDDLVLSPYRGSLPPHYNPDDENSDPGFNDLLPDEYLRYRLEDQFSWHKNKTNDLQRRRIRLQILVIALGGLGAILAALGGPFSLWVALTASMTAAVSAWLELRQYDSLVRNYSQVLLELGIIRDRWQSLQPDERTEPEFFKLVTATEGVMWSQHNLFVSKMRQAIAELQNAYRAEEAVGSAISLESTVEHAAAPTTKVIMAADGKIAANEKMGTDPILEAPQSPGLTPAQIAPRGAPRALVVMPFGPKQGPDDTRFDFNAIYDRLIRPALIEAGFEPIRADEETAGAGISSDMFQELLLADLVIADLSFDSASVFYELGVRHALRGRGVVHIQSGRTSRPFDIFDVRPVLYTCGDDGKPDPAHLDKERERIAKVIRDTWESRDDHMHSPIFQLLDGLAEPDRKALQTPLARGYWREFRDWQEQVTIARRRSYAGDVLLLTEEVRNPLIKEEAIARAGEALRSMGCYHLALEQYQRGLKINPNNLEFRRQEAFYLGRLKRLDAALVKLEGLIDDHPTDHEAIAFLGRLYKDMFIDEWINIEDDPTRLKAAQETSYLLKRAIDTYRKAYVLDQKNYYPGINTLALSMLLDHLDRDVAGSKTDPDSEIEPIRQQIPVLTGAVRFSLQEAAKNQANDFWVFASLGDLAVLMARSPKEVTRAYRKALALGGKERFRIESVLEQLKVMESLAFRPAFVRAGLDVLTDALDRLEPAPGVETDRNDKAQARHFLFSGHMIDAKERAEPRFPPDMETEARQRIEQALDKFEAGSKDQAITAGAACGGDILFIEACLKRGMEVQVYLPFVAEKFIKESVAFPKEKEGNWVERFQAIRQDPRVRLHLQPDRLGPVPEGDNPYERNNRWALYSALEHTIEQIRFIVLWDGRGGDGPGGTRHMVEEIRRFGGIVEHLDTTQFDYWQTTQRIDQAVDAAVEELP